MITLNSSTFWCSSTLSSSTVSAMISHLAFLRNLRNNFSGDCCGPGRGTVVVLVMGLLWSWSGDCCGPGRGTVVVLDCCGPGRMVVGFTPLKLPFMARCTQIQHYVRKFLCDLRQVGGFLRVLRFPPPINWPPWYNWNIVESGIKHHNPNPNNCSWC